MRLAGGLLLSSPEQMLTASAERFIVRGLPGEPEPIGVRLRRLRVERGLSQRELAGPGVSYAYISRIEAGTRRPSVKALRTLARKLSVSAEYLETGSELRDVDERELQLADAELRLRIGGEAEGAREAFARILAVAGAHERSIALLESCLAHIDEHDPENVSAYVRFAGYLSAELSDLGELSRAEAVLTEALNRATDGTDPYTRVRLYWSVARLAEYEGRASRALEYVRKAIALLEATEDTMHLARAHLLCAWIMRGSPRSSAKATRRSHVDARRSSCSASTTRRSREARGGRSARGSHSRVTCRPRSTRSAAECRFSMRRSAG